MAHECSFFLYLWQLRSLTESFTIFKPRLTNVVYSLVTSILRLEKCEMSGRVIQLTQMFCGSFEPDIVISSVSEVVQGLEPVERPGVVVEQVSHQGGPASPGGH